MRFAAATPVLALLFQVGTAMAQTDIGAGEKHWAYQPLQDAAVPAVIDHTWPRGDIDRLLLARMDAAGLRPVHDAAPRTLLRRATFDLTGLPPTPHELATFLDEVDARGLSAAFEVVLERLLASAAYGERWGRHWLDVVRYADTCGSSSDHPVPEARHYRDYVIAAFNKDKPFLQFVREQIAGDLLQHDSEQQRREHIIATGYLAGARRFGVSGKEMHLTIEDTITNLGEALLATSIACARCHDHTHDPLPTTDYYALYGIFESTRFPFPGSENQKMPTDFVSLSGDPELRAGLEDEIEQADRDLDRLKRRVRDGEKVADYQAQRRTLEKKIESARLELAGDADLAYAVADRDEGRDARVQQAGLHNQPGAEVRRGFLQVLGGEKLPDGYTGSGRLALADWLTSEQNALFARVIVNRIWAWHFGRALVTTPNDFGTHGAEPSHPALLDHLAALFIADGYSFKAMHRRILRSRAYQLSSDALTFNHSRDPEAVLRWRFERRRLSAEEIRDAMLAASGQLKPGPASAHPFPPKDKWGFTQHAPFYATYYHDHRSIYLMQQRIRRHPVLSVFDGADTNASTPLREEAAGPVSSLFLMNAPFAHRAADNLAARVLSEHRDLPAQIDLAHRLTLGKNALEEDIKLAQSYIAECRNALGGRSGGEIEAEADALASYARVLFCTNEFVYID